MGDRACMRSSLDEGQDGAPDSSLGVGLGAKAALIFLHPTNFSALQEEEVRELLTEKWARWRDIFCRQPIEEIR